MPEAAAKFAAAAVLAAAFGAGCESGAHSGAKTEAPEGSGSGSSRRPTTAPLAGERIRIPGGSFFAGSVPGEPGRRPELEPRRTAVQLGPYQIDRLPYPNDPRQPALTNVTREEAAKRCAEQGGRLCTELEWERACRGPDSDLFATGKHWDPECEKPDTHCTSAFDVVGMGAIREWTASDVVAPDDTRKAAVRGGAPGAPPEAHRCAHRRPVPARTKSEDVGFRCCKGAPNAAIVAEPREGQTFVKKEISVKRLEELLGRTPETREIATGIKFFREPDAANTVVDRGPGDRKGFLFTVSPLLWNPVAGAKFLVVPARAGDKTSFVVVFHVLGDDDYLLASSFIMRDEVGPVALAYNGYIRPRLHFSTCWGCPGETGKILSRDPDSAVILQP